jgi:hypothetical protein
VCVCGGGGGGGVMRTCSDALGKPGESGGTGPIGGKSNIHPMLLEA